MPSWQCSKYLQSDCKQVSSCAQAGLIGASLRMVLESQHCGGHHIYSEWDSINAQKDLQQLTSDTNFVVASLKVFSIGVASA